VSSTSRRLASACDTRCADSASAKIESDRRGNGDGQKVGIGEWRKLGQPHTIGKLRQEPARRGNSEPRLADAAGAGQGNEPMRGGKAEDLAENGVEIGKAVSSMVQLLRSVLNGGAMRQTHGPPPLR
jgi:hypothetical protein